MNSTERTIVFFDGVCHLCNGFVDFAISRNSKRTLMFAPLQGKTAAEMLPASDRETLASVVVWSNGQIWRGSDAVIRVMRELDFPWNLISNLRLLPRPLREMGYQTVAEKRYKLFGVRALCRIPTPEEKTYFLD